jgi:hypothetical protein
VSGWVRAELADIDVKLLREQGASVEAFMPDGPGLWRLDLDALQAAGWTVSDDGGLQPPAS